MSERLIRVAKDILAAYEAAYDEHTEDLRSWEFRIDADELRAAIEEAEIGHCRDCKWWAEMTTWVTPPRNVKRCDCPKIAFAVAKTYPPRWIECDLVRESDESQPIRADEAAVTDGEEYRGEFNPGPDFGCIHWEAK